MAIFFADLKVFSRARGHSAVAAAAYRSGMRFTDARTGVVHDYRRRKGVVDVAMFAPLGAPRWAHSPARLFVEAERAETRVNARTARELQIALPFELDPEQRARLVAELAGVLVERYGVAVLAATHEPSGKGDERNIHTHFLFTTRAVTPGGFGPKVRCLDDRKTGPEEVEFLRGQVAERSNAALKAAGVAARVDHRRLSVQAAEAEAAGDIARAVLLTRAPLRTEGKAATAARRRGEYSQKAAWNALVRHDNRMVLARFLRKAKGIRPRPAQAFRLDGRTEAALDRFEHARGLGARALDARRINDRLARRDSDAAVRRWLAMLERVRLDIAEDSRRRLAMYAAAMSLKKADALALAEHGARDPHCFDHLERAMSARRKYRQASERERQARAAHGEAMVRTAQAERAVQDVESKSKPPVWQPMTRRAWAEHRRRQRAAMMTAQQAEEASARAAAAIDAGVALAQWQRAEQKRRVLYPLPSDDHVEAGMGNEAPRKIGNKIGGTPAGSAAARPAFVPRPRPRRRRAPGA